MARRPYIGLTESQARKTWHWCIFAGDGSFVCRGKTRLEAIRRAERAEGRYGHGHLLVAKNDRSGERWVRLRGAWHLSEAAKERAA